jgi:sulfatase modifying factor 1
MKTHSAFTVVVVVFAGIAVVSLRAQPLVNVETVTVGDPGNAADTTGYGAVTNVFAIGKYEVTISQYTTFLNSVASVTSYSYIIDLWSASMTNDLNIAGINRSGSGTGGDPYSYSVIGNGNRPITYVGWFDAARFANYMNNGATNGASTETGAYTLNGATTGNITKNAGATWWIPSENEWYKAAYYKRGGTNADYWPYPTQSDTAPGNIIGSAINQANIIAGGAYSVTQSGDYDDSQNYLTDVGVFSNSASAYGTYDQGGNVWEMYDPIDDSEGGVRGGSWGYAAEELLFSTRYPLDPGPDGVNDIGFRLATVPEPSTYALLLMSGAGALWWASRKRG